MTILIIIMFLINISIAFADILQLRKYKAKYDEILAKYNELEEKIKNV